MMIAVEKDHFEDFDWSADEEPLLKTLFKAFFDRGDVFAGYISASDLVLEVEMTLLMRAHGANDSAILARSTGLFLVGVIELDEATDSFTESHLGCTDFNLRSEFSFHPLDIYFEVEFAHSGDDGFSAGCIKCDPEGGILFGESLQRLRHIVGGFTINRPHCQADDGLWDMHR